MDNGGRSSAFVSEGIYPRLESFSLHKVGRHDYDRYGSRDKG